jgi:oligoribonuclease
MATGQKYPQRLAWIDIETTGLDLVQDQILEIALVVTDFALNKESGYSEVIKLTQEGLNRLKGGDSVVVKMHQANGLLKESRAAEFTLADVEAELIKILKETTLDKGEFMIAGSGVAAYDHPLLKQQMPEFASWLAYYPFDVGVLRRTTKILTGKDIVNPTPGSYQDGVKVHRAMSDVLAHIEEAEKYQERFQAAF